VIPVPPDALALYAVVILLLPLAAFFLSSPTFFLVGLDVPEVTDLLRGIFNGYFRVIGLAGIVAMVLLAAAGRPAFAVGAIVIAAYAIAVRRWLLQRMDAGLRARDAGIATAVRQIRVLHVQSMVMNAIPLAIVVTSVPHIV
jgi:hypothetical protein